MSTQVYLTYGIVSDTKDLLAVYLDRGVAEDQIRYFAHRNPSIIILKGEL